MRLPTLKAIMAEKKCTIELARTYRAMMEADADTEHFRKTGKHLLPVVSARDLERHPELAVQDAIRPKASDGKPAEALNTHEAQASFLLAALEDGDPEFFAHCVGIVAKANKMDCITVTVHLPAHRRARRRAAVHRRELAMA